MLSIITAVYNGLAMNRIYWEYLKRYTFHPFELIIIDNGSTDGSDIFFESCGAHVIRNKANYSYPYCQNQGIERAQYKTYAFLNNDIIVAPHWDKHLLDIARRNDLELITPSGIERQPTVKATRNIRRRWNAIKNAVSLFGQGDWQYRAMHRLMYGNWERYSERRRKSFGNATGEGFVGNTVVMQRSAIDKIGPWDPRIQAADFDLYIRSKKRHLEKRDIRPVHIAWGVLNHHYIRVTVKSRPPEFADKNNMISLDSKWGAEKQKYLADIDT